MERLKRPDPMVITKALLQLVSGNGWQVLWRSEGGREIYKCQ